MHKNRAAATHAAAPPATAGGSDRLCCYTAWPMGADLPLAYFITFRSYGSWLHGDERGSVDRSHNQYGSPLLPHDDDWVKQERHLLKLPAVVLDPAQRDTVERAIRDTCFARKWCLRAINVRTNHVHSVVSSNNDRPELVLNAFKANATRLLRHERQWSHGYSPWSGGGSKRYLWDLLSIERAIEYVMNWQDGVP